jgi:RNA polymerase sigma-70 factor (ECF subfamily)
MTLASAWGDMLVPLVSEPPARDETLELERRLVERAQAGDREALGLLLSRHGPALYRSVLLPRLGSEASAQDALSEVYTRVIARIGSFTWQGVGFWPWLRTVGLHVALDQLRGRRRLVFWSEQDVAREIDEADAATPADQAFAEQRERHEARARVERVLAKIHPRYAKAIRHRVLEELEREDVARLLGVSPATFDVVLHRAMRALRKALDDEAPEDV